MNNLSPKLLYITFLILCTSLTNSLAQREDPGKPNWQKYHSTADAYSLLEGWAKKFPELTSLYSIGETLKGTQLLVLEITNKQTGEASDKPAYYYDGNIHAVELTGAEVVLHFAWHILSNYDSDPRIKNLVDTRTLYIRPKFNPDGADLVLTTHTELRSTPRPYDEDRDGLLDEDPTNDLDGDGEITSMRISNPNGLWKISMDDDRIMVRREDGDYAGDYYDIFSEGIDDDNDGAFNEDGVGGIDMNRNFPRNWGLESEQRGAGPFPLSEPETRATIEFINSHRNITGVFHGHTSGGFLFRLPSTTSWDNFNMADQRLILELSDKYTTTTKQLVRPSYSNPRVHRHGTLISWSYWDFGVVAFVPEFWGGFGEDYDDNGSVSEQERFTWNDKILNGSGFTKWKKYKHPQLGDLEIGGWKSKFTRQNPPVQLLKNEIEKYVPWMLWLAEISPKLVLKKSSFKFLDKGSLVKINLDIENTGYLPTNITQRAIDANIASPVRVKIELKEAYLISGAIRQNLGHIKGSRDSQSERQESKRHLEYVVKIDGKNPRAIITIKSEKGGVIRKEILLVPK